MRENGVGWDKGRDLTPFLTNLAAQRKTPEAKRKLANHPVTLFFLMAGVSLFSDDPMHLGAVTKPRVIEEAERIAEAQPIEDGQGDHTPNEAKFRDRWPFIDEYRADLLSYCLSWQHWSLHLADDGKLHAQLSREPGFYEAIQEVAYQDLTYIRRHDFSKVPFLMALSVNHDPAAKAALRKTNLDLRQLWGRLCRHVISKRGLRLRPGATIDDLADLLIILTDGVALRILSDENSDLVDHDKRESLLGTGAAAVVAGFLDLGDGKPLQQVLNDLGQADAAPSAPG